MTLSFFIFDLIHLTLINIIIVRDLKLVWKFNNIDFDNVFYMCFIHIIIFFFSFDKRFSLCERSNKKFTDCLNFSTNLIKKYQLCCWLHVCCMQMQNKSMKKRMQTNVELKIYCFGEQKFDWMKIFDSEKFDWMNILLI